MYGKLFSLAVLHAQLWSTTTAFVIPTRTTGSSALLQSSYSYEIGRDGSAPATRDDTFSETKVNGGVAKVNGSGAVALNGKKVSMREPVTGGLREKEREPTKVPKRKPMSTLWQSASSITVQGGSLRTWTFPDPAVERVQVFMKTDGRPLNADIDLWHGPNNTPQKMRVYLENGSVSPFSAVVETPRGSNVIAIRNTGHLEFPMTAGVEPEVRGSAGLGPPVQRLSDVNLLRTVQGGSVQTFPFASNVSSVLVYLRTDGRPLNARIELMQGPTQDKQVVDIYAEDGRERPFFAVIETPGHGNVVRLINTGSVEFPMTACVEPYLVDPDHIDTVGQQWYPDNNNFFMGGRNF